MKTNRYLLGLALLVAGTMPAFSQVSNDNEDEVYKIAARVGQNDFVPGQVLVKFKDESPVNVTKTRGAFRSVNNDAVDAVLKEFGVESMDKLLPYEKKLLTRRKTRAYNGQIVEEKDLSQLYTIQMKSSRRDSTMMLINQLNELEEVEYAEPNYKVYLLDNDNEMICVTPNQNPLFNQQWGIGYLNIGASWNNPIIAKRRPVIAIVDTGVDINHPDLKDNIWTNPKEGGGNITQDDDGNGYIDDEHGWDFIDNYPYVSDENGHGTHVAGIAAACNNELGIVGANPLAYIMPVKVFPPDGCADMATVARGIIYAAENGADIINMSFGTGPELPLLLKEALDKAFQTSILVASAGNNGKSIYDNRDPINPGTIYPAAYYCVLGVQALQQDGSLAGYSNYDPDGPFFSRDGVDGRNYELKAPGTDIISTVPDGDYRYYNGTSMAAPIVSGAISALQMVKEYGNREMLFGDLIHLECDLAKLLDNSMEKGVAIDFVALRIDDSEGNSDGSFDAGEIIKLYPTLRSTWKNTSNIKLNLMVDDIYKDFVTIINNDVDFGFMPSYYGRNESLNPIIIQLASSIGDGTRIKMKLTITADGMETPCQTEFIQTVNKLVRIGGIINENTTLTADHVYYVTDNLAVPESVTLKIEPGTRLEFDEGIGLISFGKLQARGTPGKPIVFTKHQGVESWAGIQSHESAGINIYRPENVLYTNSDCSLFTLLPTEETPFIFERPIEYIYTKENEDLKYFYLSDYLGIGHELYYSIDMNARKEDLKNPEYITSAVLKLLSDWDDYCDSHKQSEENIHFWMHWPNFLQWCTYENPRDTISYCIIEGFDAYNHNYYPYMEDCIITVKGRCDFLFEHLAGIRNNITEVHSQWAVYSDGNGWPFDLTHSNFVNNYFGDSGAAYLPRYSMLKECNYFNNTALQGENSKYAGKEYKIAIRTASIEVDKSDNPPYLGTSKEELMRPYVFEIGNAPNTYGSIDLSNMRKAPVPEAHGIVWKVVVNGKDAQDEYTDLDPLGVGKHKFEIYFNRPMNKEKIPHVSFGVREPYTQNTVAENGSWNDEGTIYTVYVTITGKTQSDGVNRIYVYGAEDNEFFECPYEKSRFNVNIQSLGSLSTGLSGEAGLGRVELSWNELKTDVTDVLGYNVYRFTNDPNDSIRLNNKTIDATETHFTDYDIKPGTTYYYKYKVQSTDLQEFQASNVVAVTPLTAKLGDVTGNNEVDVFDIVYEVNYILGQKPKAFVKCAADVNNDNVIDVLDVQGIIKTILDPSAATRGTRSDEATATYTIEDGILYVESPVALGGVQVQVNVPEKTDITTLDDLKGFEQAGAWLSRNDYLFLAYNMKGKTLSAGKHALLRIGDGDVTSITIGDANGMKLSVTGGDGTTAIDNMATAVKTQKGIYNLKGQKVAGSADELRNLPKGIYIVDGNKVLK